jgi:hypothetical protein
MSGTTSKLPKAVTLARMQAFISGLQKHFPNQSLNFGKQAFTTASLVAVFQTVIDAIQAVNTAHAALKDAVSALRAVETQQAPVIRGFKRFVLAAFGAAAQELSDFGLQPPKVKQPLSTEQRAAAKAKAKATRAARGTDKGKKKRLSVKGDVTGVEITPVTQAPASPNQQAPKQQ